MYLSNDSFSYLMNIIHFLLFQSFHAKYWGGPYGTMITITSALCGPYGTKYTWIGWLNWLLEYDLLSSLHYDAPERNFTSHQYLDMRAIWHESLCILFGVFWIDSLLLYIVCFPPTCLELGHMARPCVWWGSHANKFINLRSTFSWCCEFKWAF